MLFLVARFSYDIRDFSAMKAIYIYPGIAAFMIVFTHGMQAVIRRVGARSSVAGVAIYAAVGLLLAVYTIDICVLISDLARLNGAPL